MPVGVGAARAGVASPTDGPGVTAIDRKVLPRAGSADVTTGGAVVSAGGLPVSITALAAVDLDVLTQRTAARAAVAPVRVRVTVADEGVARAAGVAGVVFALAAPGSASGSKVRLRVDYSSFANAFGGGYGERLRLVRYPDCLLTNPGQRRVPAFSRSNSGRPTGPAQSTQLTLAGQTTTQPETAGMVLGLLADATSPGATFDVSSLSPTYSWSAGSQGGSFSWRHPLKVPA